MKPLAALSRTSLSLLLAGVVYVVLATTTVTGVGVVGEVATTWSTPTPPAVVLDWRDGQAVLADGQTFGPLVASQTRPLERVQLGPVAIPLAVNSYTGAIADWPARILYAITGSRKSVVGLHVFLGGVLLLLYHRFLSLHGSQIAGGVAALALAADWSFIYYRKVLGGTEVLLQAAALLALWALWSRRWAGGRHGTAAIGIAIGLGLLAKITFAPTLIALAIAAGLTRWDHRDLKPPKPIQWAQMVGIVLLLTLPIWLTLAHHGLAAPSPHVVSHDFLGLQWEKLTGGLSSSWDLKPTRESGSTLSWFLLEPLRWFEAAHGAEVPPGYAPWRLVGLGVLLGGTARTWWHRERTPSAALLRLVSLFVPLQLSLLWVANHDLHHLAQATPAICAWLGLSAESLAGALSPPRSARRGALALVFGLPWMVSGVRMLSETDTMLASLATPLFLEANQSQLDSMLTSQHVETVWTSDYELSGLLETRLPGLQVFHTWGAVSRKPTEREFLLKQILRSAAGSHYLAVRPSEPLIYNLFPSQEAVLTTASSLDLSARVVETLSDNNGPWAELYELTRHEHTETNP